MNEHRNTTPALLLTLLVLSMVGIMVYSIQSMGGLLPEPASSLAPAYDKVFYFVFYLSLVFFTGVVGAILFFAWKYFRRHREERPPVLKESKLLELTWVIIPTILVIAVFTWGFKNYVKLSVEPPPAYEIKVTGRQWQWQFTYPDGVTSLNEFYVPVGQTIRLLMSSEDVIHSFYIPDFRIKFDVLPNQYTKLWFKPTKEGEYTVYCAEYCGTSHSGMLAKLHVVSQEEFDEWLTSSGGPAEGVSLAEYGAEVFVKKGCNACHSTDGTRLVGPTLKGLFGKEEILEDGTKVIVDENYLRESILEPNAKIVKGYQPVMPPYKGLLNEQELDALIEYIKSLK